MIVVDVAEADFVIENVDERDVILLTLRTRPLGDGNCDGIMSEPISGEMRSDGWSDRGVSEVGSHRMGGGRGGEARPGVWLS